MKSCYLRTVRPGDINKNWLILSHLVLWYTFSVNLCATRLSHSYYPFWYYGQGMPSIEMRPKLTYPIVYEVLNEHWPTLLYVNCSLTYSYLKRYSFVHLYCEWIIMWCGREAGGGGKRQYSWISYRKWSLDHSSQKHECRMW